MSERYDSAEVETSETVLRFHLQLWQTYVYPFILMTSDETMRGLMVFQRRAIAHQRPTSFASVSALAGLCLLLLLSACGGASGGTGTTSTTNGPQCPSTNGITGAGSTFDFPLFF